MTNITPVSAAADLARYVSLLWQPGDVREVRIMTTSGTDSGYFDDPAALVAAATALDGRANIYLTVNPVQAALLARAANRIKPRAKSTTADLDIVERRWLPIDIDPRRPSGISATDAECSAALSVTHAVYTYLSGAGWPAPIIAMSGNGWLMLFPISLPNDAASAALVAGVLKHLAGRFDNDQVMVDTTVSNAARIVALIGTRKVKGDATPDRPHRRSGLVNVPTQFAPVPIERLRELVPATNGHKPPSMTTGDRMPVGWVRDWLDGAHVSYRDHPADAAGIAWYGLEVCPFHPDDGTPWQCGVGEGSDGRAAGKCFHNRGAGKGWQQFRDALGLEGPPPRSHQNGTRPKHGDKGEARGSDEATGGDGPDQATGDKGPEPEAAPRPAALIVGIDDYRAGVPTEIPWRCTLIAYSGGVTLIAGPPKSGKSTLAAQLQRCCETGEPFLGAWAVTVGPVLLVTEEGGIAVVYKTNGLHRLDILDRRAAAGLTFAQVLAAVGQWGAAHPGGLVFIDTLAIWAGIENENDASEATKAVAAVTLLAQSTGLAIALVHHVRKSGGDNGEAIRGSGAILATVDIAVELSRVDAHSDDRWLDIQGRVIMPERFLLTFDRLTQTYALGDRAEARLEEIEADLVGIPADGPGLTRNDLHGLWKRDPRKRTEQLLNVGRLRAEYAQHGRAWAYRYWSVPAVWTPPMRDSDD